MGEIGVRTLTYDLPLLCLVLHELTLRGCFIHTERTRLMILLVATGGALTPMALDIQERLDRISGRDCLFFLLVELRGTLHS